MINDRCTEIAGIRSRLRMSQSEFAAQLEVAQSSVSRFEAGLLIPDARTLMAARWLLHAGKTEPADPGSTDATEKAA